MAFKGSRRLKARAEQKDQAKRANRAFFTQDNRQAELRQRLDREAGLTRPQEPTLIKRNRP
jgi:hypothetical protein